jgi:hypothetical protein
MRFLIVGIVACLLYVASCTDPSGPKETPPPSHPGSITIENGSYQSYLIPMKVMVVDTDLAGTTAPVRVRSTADPAGFILPLKKVTGATGTYSDSVFFSIVNTDSAGRRIKVQDGDTVTVVYTEASPAHTDSAIITLWTGTAGSIMIENGSYQGCQSPMVVTVVDSDLAGATVPIRVRSTTNPAGFILPLKQVTGATGTYTDTVFFSIVNSDSAGRRIRVQDGDIVTAVYAEASPARVDSSFTQWSGSAGIFGPGASMYVGLKSKLVITLYDPDLTDSTVTIRVKSPKDTAGIDVVMHQQSGYGPGNFDARVGFSLTASIPDSVIAVDGKVMWEDTLYMIYHDAAPEGVIFGSICRWLPIQGQIFLDSAEYHGTAGAMGIILADDEITDSSVVVTVKSQTDTVGISDTLKADAGTPGQFSGHVGFSPAASAPGLIAVQDSDTVTVTYMDFVPITTVTQQAVWRISR